MAAELHRGLGDRGRLGHFAGRSTSRDLEMSQFWQNLQPRLQPAVPNDRTRGAGKKVIERLLLDRIDAEAGAATVGGQDHLAVEVLTHEAEAAIARLQ